jgi:hypothetical protein
MKREVAELFEAAITEGTLQITELFEIERLDGTTEYLTYFQDNIIWGAGGNTYVSKTMTRGPMRFNADGQIDTFDLFISDPDIIDKVDKGIYDGCTVTVKRIMWSKAYAAGWEIILMVATPNIEYNSHIILMRNRNAYDDLKCLVPTRVWQEPCNNVAFDINCALSENIYKYEGTATTGNKYTLSDSNAGTIYKVHFDGGDSGNPVEIGDTITGQTGSGTAKVLAISYITDSTGYLWYCEQSGTQFVDDEELQNGGSDSIYCDGTPEEDATFYLYGELKMTSGDNSGQSRQIFTCDGSSRSVLIPFSEVVKSSDTYEIYPGCDQTVESCHYKFDNDKEWDGYQFIPTMRDSFL